MGGIGGTGAGITPRFRQIARVPHGSPSPDNVDAIRRRDPETLEHIAREHFPLLLRSARASGLGDADARDAVQDALLTFLDRAPDFDGRAPVGKWLLGILYKKCQERRRAVARDRQATDLEESGGSAEPRRFDADGRWLRAPLSPEAYTATGQAMDWLQQCLDALPERRRLVFHLRDVEQLETDEICKIMEMSPNTLGVLLFRTRNALRECLEAKGLRRANDATL